MKQSGLLAQSKPSTRLRNMLNRFSCNVSHGISVDRVGSQKTVKFALNAYCQNVLFPYAREAIDNVVVKGGFPALMLAPINFDAFYQQAMEKARAEGTAGGEEATH